MVNDLYQPYWQSILLHHEVVKMSDFFEIDFFDIVSLKSVYAIPIREPFQGAIIGPFTVLAPTKARYLDLIVESERTPESVEEAERSTLESLGQLVQGVAIKAAAIVASVRAAWGEEIFSPEET